MQRGTVWVDRESQFVADAEEESQRVRRCFKQLRDIAMSGYDVWGETGCWGGSESVRFCI